MKGFSFLRYGIRNPYYIPPIKTEKKEDHFHLDSNFRGCGICKYRFEKIERCKNCKFD